MFQCSEVRKVRSQQRSLRRSGMKAKRKLAECGAQGEKWGRCFQKRKWAIGPNTINRIYGMRTGDWPLDLDTWSSLWFWGELFLWSSGYKSQWVNSGKNGRRGRGHGYGWSFLEVVQQRGMKKWWRSWRATWVWSKVFVVFITFFFLTFCFLIFQPCCVQHAGSPFPTQGSNPRPLHGSMES